MTSAEPIEFRGSDGTKYILTDEQIIIFRGDDKNVRATRVGRPPDDSRGLMQIIFPRHQPETETDPVANLKAAISHARGKGTPLAPPTP